MNKIDFLQPPTQLKEFEDYQDFLNYSRSLFDLRQDEHKGLYNVLLKLQGVGVDAVRSMDTWQKDMDKDEYQEFIRLMIQVDDMPIE